VAFSEAWCDAVGTVVVSLLTPVRSPGCDRSQIAGVGLPSGHGKAYLQAKTGLHPPIRVVKTKGLGLCTWGAK